MIVVDDCDDPTSEETLPSGKRYHLKKRYHRVNVKLMKKNLKM